MSALVFALVLATAPHEGFSRRGQWAVGIDHLAGVAHLDHLNEGMTPSRVEVGQTHVGLLGGSLVPRLSVHRFVAGCSLGLGAQLAVARFGNRGVVTWGFAPRLGLVAPLGADVALWLRAGPTYLRSSALGDVERGGWSLAAGGEALLVWSVGAHFSIVAGPFIEAGLGGREWFEPLSHADPDGNLVVESEASVRTRIYGLSVGVFVDL